MTPVEQIKERLNLVDIVQEYIPLKKMGTNYKGLCPFHNEKSPSFSVSQERQFFYCFGCAKGGDLFQFVQDMEHIDFAEALRLLAVRAGVELRQESKQDRTRSAQLRDCLDLAARFFEATLQQSQEADMARQYLVGRGLTDDTIKQWRLGYSSDQWDALYQFLQKKGYATADMEEVGLIARSQKTGGWYDRFRGRVMFPICDTHGSVIGFTARSLKADEPGAKYINTPTTELYNKSAVLYGLHQARTAIAAAKQAVLVEGNMDVVRCHQAGITNVVAVSGTALTADQVRLLKRYADTVLLAFDGDAAGVRAMWRGMAIALAAGLTLRILRLPPGEDPDDIVGRDPELFRGLIAGSLPLLEYAMEQLIAPINLNDPDEKKQAARELLPMIAWLPEMVEKQHYLNQLSDQLGVPIGLLQEELARLPARPTSPALAVSPPAAVVAALPDHLTQLLQRILALAVLDQARWQELDHAAFQIYLTSPALQELYNACESFYNQTSSPTESSTPPATALQSFLLQADEWYGSLSTDLQAREWTTLRKQLERDTIQHQLSVIQQSLRAAELSGDHDRLTSLTLQFQEVTKALKQVQ